MDLLLRNGVVRGEAVDIAITAGRIETIGTVLGLADRTVDLGGRLVLPPLIEPHIHLDAALTVGEPRPNCSGTLAEGIAVWADRARAVDEEDVNARVRQVLRWQIANGVQHVRSHVDISDPRLRALRALREIREELRGQIDLQLVAFPQQGIFSYDGGTSLMRQAAELGVDAIGGIPHFELTREDGVESVRFSFALAQEFGLMVDIHCDETDDDHSRFIETMVAETIRRDLAGRVTASHTTAMHSYNGAYVAKLIAGIARARLHMVTNPLSNSMLQGRFDAGPIRRGHTRVRELQAAGVNVCVGHDSVMDPWYPLGYADPLQAAFVLAHMAQLSGEAELPWLIEMITTNPAKALGVKDYGLRVGGSADLVVFDAPTAIDALRLVAPRILVLRAGRELARTAPRETTVVWDGVPQPLQFVR